MAGMGLTRRPRPAAAVTTGMTPSSPPRLERPMRDAPACRAPPQVVR
jgi:hypothetical protein